jgi:pSer/pThr/pTyr-binding forkhead associated (FHA) protein
VEQRGAGKWVVSDMGNRRKRKHTKTDFHQTKKKGSNSGTRLNGNKVTQFVLKPGDVIEVGSSRITFKAK